MLDFCFKCMLHEWANTPLVFFLPAYTHSSSVFYVALIKQRSQPRTWFHAWFFPCCKSHCNIDVPALGVCSPRAVSCVLWRVFFSHVSNLLTAWQECVAVFMRACSFQEVSINLWIQVVYICVCFRVFHVSLCFNMYTCLICAVPAFLSICERFMQARERFQTWRDKLFQCEFISITVGRRSQFIYYLTPKPLSHLLTYREQVHPVSGKASVTCQTSCDRLQTELPQTKLSNKHRKAAGEM